MEAWESVTADPSLRDGAPLEMFFACNAAEKTQTEPPDHAYFSADQFRAEVHTGDLKPPFASLEGSNVHVVQLCTMCHGMKSGWPVVINPRKYGKGQSSCAFQPWAARVRAIPRKQIARTCII